MRTRGGWTLIEILAVLSVTALMSSLLYPAFTEARRGAKQARCMTNLKQIALVVSLYRTEWGGDGVFGPIEKMGLPALTSSLIEGTHADASTFRCVETTAEGRTRPYLKFFTPEGMVGVPSWASYVEAHREQSILFGDVNHDIPGTNSSPFMPHRALALHLDGHVTMIIRAGSRYDRDWWHPELSTKEQ